MELDISNKELEQFAYVASHDLQEPLRMISSFLGQLEKKYTDILDEKGKQYIFFAVDGAKRMKSIILDLLEYSRVGRIADPVTPVDLNRLMEEVKSLLKIQIEENNAELVFSDLPLINSQKSQLRQVIQNIVSNAIKYRKKTLTIIPLKQWNQKSIEDFNFCISISSTDYKKILLFSKTTTRKSILGTSIGLAICEIVENLSGKYR